MIIEINSNIFVVKYNFCTYFCIVHYYHQTSDMFSVGVKSEKYNSEIRYLIARPEKTLCDVIYQYA